MQVFVRLQRHRGVPLLAAELDSVPWTSAELETARVDGARCLVLRDMSAKPKSNPLATLYGATISSVDRLHLFIRGFERVDDGAGLVAGMCQEWQVRAHPQFGGLGLHHPEAKGMVRHIVRPRS